MEQRNFLLTTAARPFDRRVARAALAAFAASCVIFIAVAPLASVQLPAIWAFVPSYQSALAINDLITAVLLFAQFPTIRSRALLLLASGYLFTALMAVAHALSFPGLFTPTGLLGAGPQTTAWLYMFWHGGFPLAVIGYALLKGGAGGLDTTGRSARALIATSVIAALAVAAGVTLLATVGQDALPAIMQGNGHTPVYMAVVTSTWALSLMALVVLWSRRPHSVLDLWLLVVMVVWLFDVALAAVFSAGRFDLGFYVGRVYGLVAASVVLMALLIETGMLYARLARVYEEDRRRAADKISSINARLDTLLDSSPLPVFSLDPKGRVATWNSAAERIFGRSAGEIVGQDFAALPENEGSDFAAVHARVMAGERLQESQMRWKHHDGRPLDVVHSGAPVREAGERITGAVYVSEDVTDKRKLERQLAQSQKMEAVGQLTGGIAHDFNNILTVITGTIEILADGVADRPDLASIAKLIDEAATRGAELTRQLLAFARKQPLQPRETDINALAAEAASLLRPTLGEQVEIESVLEADAWPALVDRGQLVTAIINLGINARDAMPGGGKLTLETANVMLDEGYARLNADVHAGPYVMVAVSDTGTGIPAALLDKVLEPFFTTKEVGKGTGLGLSMVYGFVKQSGGHIKIYSEEGHGTSIKLYLPRASGQALPLAEAAPLAAQEGRHERILVVEDDRMVREHVVGQLTSLGYTTLAAADAAAALALLDDGAEPDLLFTDVIMPGGVNGRVLAEQALRRRPGLKVLFTSGYTETAIVHHGRLDPGVLLLAKPYRKVDLARMVRRALDAAPTPAVEPVA
ncbi:MAG TPA: MASE4 domain-containing protein [Xanthobacteraceae bacterium]|nr:MASE4 domain-containing protein [Xanthobacteraceae bacterium]